MTDYEDKFDDIDPNDLFDDFHDKSTWPLQHHHLLIDDDEITEFNETDCTNPKVQRKIIRAKKKLSEKQTTMYDYASSVAYENRQFYSSLDNKETSKTIIKGQKRSAKESRSSVFVMKKTKKDETNKSPRTTPDFIDSLLRYLDERSHPNRTRRTDSSAISTLEINEKSR